MDREALLNLPPPRPIVDVVTSVKKMLASGEAVSGTEVKVTNTLSLCVSLLSFKIQKTPGRVLDALKQLDGVQLNAAAIEVTWRCSCFLLTWLTVRQNSKPRSSRP